MNDTLHVPPKQQWLTIIADGVEKKRTIMPYQKAVKFMINHLFKFCIDGRMVTGIYADIVAKVRASLKMPEHCRFLRTEKALIYYPGALQI